MGRIRAIKPGFFINEDLAALGSQAMLLFAGLWTLADKEGRLEDRPVRIKAQIFPYTTASVDGILRKLTDSGFIIRYVVDGQKFIQVNNWNEHQRPHNTEKQSVIPTPSETDVVSPLNNRSITSTSILDGNNTPLPIPRTLKRGSGGDNGFGEFWVIYPRKTHKKEARKAWAKIKPNLSMKCQIIESVKEHQETEDWRSQDGRFIPYPSTFLNGELWDDEIQKPKKQTSKEHLADIERSIRK